MRIISDSIQIIYTYKYKRRLEPLNDLRTKNPSAWIKDNKNVCRVDFLSAMIFAGARL